jgi:integrase
LKSKFALCSKAEWEAVGPLVREAVGRLDGVEGRGLRAYLTGMTRLAAWAFKEGLPLEVDVLLSHPVIEAHAASLPANAGTFRSQLRRLAAANGVAVEETAAGYARPGYHAPYRLDEVEALLRFAGSLSNVHRRRQLTGFVLLGAGCGFSRGELRGICKNRVHEHDGRRHVASASRCTPILEPFVAHFDAFLQWCGDGPFVGVTDGVNVTARMASWVADRAGLPQLSTDRLRTFFVVEHLRMGTPLLELMSYCGFTRLDSLTPYMAFVPAFSHVCDVVDGGVL